jgi:YbbR domain-containing protein
MRGLFENLLSAVLALLLALFIWVAAVREQNPMVRGLFSEPIPVEVLNKPAGLDFLNPAQITEYVQVLVRAPQSSWDDLKAASFQASVDLSDLTEGMHDVPIEVRCSDPIVRIEGSQPGRISVRLERIQERVFEVKVRIMDDPALGYEARTPMIDPPTAKVIGPVSKVSQVQTVVADIYLRRTKTTVERDVVLTARDAQDNLVSLLTSIDPVQVAVTIPIEQKLGYRDVSVSVIRKGQVARGYRITGITVDPSVVTIIGSPLTVSQMSGYVETLPVDISDATSDVKARIGVVLPEGISILGDQMVSITVSVAPIIDSVTIQRPVSIQGLQLGYTALTSPSTVDVILSGPVPKLEAISIEDVRVVVDLFGLQPGVYKITAQSFASEGLTVESVLPEAIEVEIKSPLGLITTTPVRRSPTPAALSTLATTPAPSATPASTPTLTRQP